MKQHRYEQIAHALGERITTGVDAVGATLPTEAQLCRRYRVSRYTAREALRCLRDAGLITRRRRAGTTVASARTRTDFSLPVGSASELFRYASDIRLVLESRARVHADAALASLLRCRRGREWLCLDGVRRESGKARPVCVISVYLDRAFASLEKRIPRTGAVIYPLLEKAFGVRIAWIGQKIEAAPLSAGDAKRLGATAGSCGLRVRRYYYDANERLLQVSDSRHAGAEFAYEMRLRRD